LRILPRSEYIEIPQRNRLQAVKGRKDLAVHLPDQFGRRIGGLGVKRQGLRFGVASCKKLGAFVTKTGK